MLPGPYDGTADGGLSSTLLRLVQNDQQIQQLRQELSGFTHRCRNLLNGMKMSLYFVRRGAEQPLPEWWNGLDRNYQGIEHLFDQLQTIYRPITLSLVRARFQCLVQDRQRIWNEWFTTCAGRLEVVPPEEESSGEFDPMCLTTGLDAMVRWRAATLRSGQTARLSWCTRFDQFEVIWEETAPSGSSSLEGAAPDRQASASSGPAHQPLVMPLLARVITAHHGTMELRDEPAFRVSLHWPLTQLALCPNSPA